MMPTNIVKEILPGLIEQLIKLIPPVHREATPAEPEHVVRSLLEVGALAHWSCVSDLVNDLVLQRASDSDPQRIESCNATQPDKPFLAQNSLGSEQYP